MPTLDDAIEAVDRGAARARVEAAAWADGDPPGPQEKRARSEAAALSHALALLEGLRWVKVEDCPPEWKDGRPVLLRVEHMNYPFADGADKGMWEEVVTARWTAHNHGGWVWHGLAGKPTHVREIGPTPPQPVEGRP